MKKIFFPVLVLFTLTASAQTLSNKITFPDGKKLELVTQTKVVTTQELMGQSMEINISSSVSRIYNVKKVKDNEITIEHKIKRMQTTMEGMGQQQSFDSEKEADRNSEIGQVLEKSLKNNYTMNLDPMGRVVSIQLADDNPYKNEQEANSSPVGPLMMETEVPKAGGASIFKVLPGENITKGATWTDTINTAEMGTSVNTYKISDITANEILIDFTADGSMQKTQEAMGMQALVNLKNKSTGKIMVDKKTGLLKQKNTNLEGVGTIEVAGQKIPMSNKMTITETLTSL